MSNHIIYDEKLELSPSGLHNTGVICYFNSLLQGLFSCTSLTHLMTTNSDVINRNNLTKTYSMVLKQFLNDKQTGSKSTTNAKYSPIIWNAFMAQLKKTKKYARFGRGQEDASEGLTLLLDAFESPEVDRLFEHRYILNTICNLCNNLSGKQIDEAFICEVHKLELKDVSLMDHIKGHRPMIDDNYKCTKCHLKGDKRQIRILAMVPEVFLVQFKKYDRKWNMEFPQYLSFNNGDLKYKLVSQTEHSGSQRGGHYWSRSLRSVESNSKVMELNDMGVKPAMFQPTPNTYMAWYHVF